MKIKDEHSVIFFLTFKFVFYQARKKDIKDYTFGFNKYNIQDQHVLRIDSCRSNLIRELAK